MGADGRTVSPPGEPRLLLEVLSPSAEPRRWKLLPGSSARVGRTALSDFVVGGDEQLAGAHFLLEWDGVTAAVRDLGSASGTLVGGAAVTAAKVGHGAWIRAGNTDFRVYVEGRSWVRTQAEFGPLPGAVREVLLGLREGAGGHLYALLDAARSPRVLELLTDSVDEHRSLFEGLGGVSLWRVAPYLVKLEPGSSGLFERLLAEGWGRSWGIYVVSGAGFGELRRRFRRHLRVEDPDRRPMYFRLYDPRVLRRFLPMCSERQVEELFADVSTYVAEGRSPREVHVLRQSPPLVLHEEVLRPFGADTGADAEAALP